MLSQRHKSRSGFGDKFLLFTFCGWLFVAGAGCALPAMRQSLAVPGAGRVQSGDAINVSFKYYPDLNQTQIVDGEGRVRFRLVNDINVTGLKLTELKKLLAEAYRGVLAMPELEVTLHKARNFSVYFGGYIMKPGRQSYGADLTVARGIRTAGGLKTANGYDIYIFRSTGQKGLRRLKLEWSRKPRHAGQNKDMKLAPYDVVFIVKAPQTRRSRGWQI